MVLGFSRDKFGKKPKLPWDSIDPADGESPTTWETDSHGRWTLEAAPDAPIDPPADVAQPAQPLRAAASPIPLLSADPRASTSPALTAQLATSPDQDESDQAEQPIEALTDDVGDEEPYPPRQAAETGAWTISILCMGLGLIAACVLIPQADANRRLVYEREQLRLDLQQIQKQTLLNRQFLSKMEVDPQLTERLAQREMHAVEQGEQVVSVNGQTSILQGPTASAAQMSPFSLVKLPPPPALEPYQPVGGTFAELCRNPQTHIYVLGAGMFLVAAGLVLGGPARGELQPAEGDLPANQGIAPSMTID